MAATEKRTHPTGSSPSLAEEFDIQITREWLITNGRGGYASGTVLGMPTRRYHGLLVASARPPLNRWLLLAAVLERVSINGRVHEFASFEFNQALHPQGYRYQSGFDVSNDPRGPWVRFDFEADEVRLTRHVLLSRERDEVQIAYRIDGPSGAEVVLDVLPFTPMRDFHGITHRFEGGFPVHPGEGRAVVEAYPGGPRLVMSMEHSKSGEPAVFEHQPDWWNGFVYREELHRGFDEREDLFVPGFFRISGSGSMEVRFRAAADFTGGEVKAEEPAAVCVAIPPHPRESVEARLRDAADAFVVARRRVDGSRSTTILAGYHWFGDWGRDAFIALPGLLLETQRFAEAREVLETFASAQKDGLIPNRFSDYGDGCDYNSVDASLWYLHAADCYLRVSGDRQAWRDFLERACRQVVESFVRGTQFNIHVDSDGLVACGDATTQITWMDAKFGDIVFTPRHGKPVEINALWYHGLLALADHAEADDPQLAGRYRALAEQAGQAFRVKFWNPADRCLYDVVRDGVGDRSIRPNQILAVSLPHTPLDEAQRRAVLFCVECELLTPYGLRSLSPRDPHYRGRCEGSPFERDSAYHQGTVWGWLMGPYIEAYLRVHDFTPAALKQARQMLMPLVKHLDEAGIGSVSEIFDGDPPHTPRGCIAQAWSVSELLRAWRLTETPAK